MARKLCAAVRGLPVPLAHHASSYAYKQCQPERRRDSSCHYRRQMRTIVMHCTALVHCPDERANQAAAQGAASARERFHGAISPS